MLTFPSMILPYLRMRDMTQAMKEEIYAIVTTKFYQPYLGAFSLRIHQSSH